MDDDDDKGKTRINNILRIMCINIFIHQRVHTYRRVSFQRTLRGSAMVTSGGRRGGGMEPVCNKINRGVARERTERGERGDR